MGKHVSGPPPGVAAPVTLALFFGKKKPTTEIAASPPTIHHLYLLSAPPFFLPPSGIFLSEAPTLSSISGILFTAKLSRRTRVIKLIRTYLAGTTRVSWLCAWPHVHKFLVGQRVNSVLVFAGHVVPHLPGNTRDRCVIHCHVGDWQTSAETSLTPQTVTDLHVLCPGADKTAELARCVVNVGSRVSAVPGTRQKAIENRHGNERRIARMVLEIGYYVV